MTPYLCIEEEEYAHSRVEHIFDNEEQALTWLKSIDAGEHDKATIYDLHVINEIQHLVDGDDDPLYRKWKWKELWYKYDGYENWWRVEKRNFDT